MSGILLLLALALWLVLAIWAGAAATSRISERKWRAPVCVLSVVALFLLPFLDEIVGRRQFERLCKEHSSIHVTGATAGKTVYLADSPNVELSGTWVPITQMRWQFVDATTGELVVSYNTLQAGGGWLFSRLNESGAPMLFSGSCEPGAVVDPVKLLAKLGLTQVQRSEVPLRASKPK